MTILYLIRHGETDWNKKGKYTGQMDVPINETGIMQAKKAAQQLKGLNPDLIYTSDLLRAVQTAETISDSLEIPIRTDPRLREINQGEWEGLHVNEIEGQYTNLFNARNKDPLNVAAPGGESIGDVKKRVEAFLDEVLKSHLHQKIVISSHGIVLGIIRTLAAGIPVDQVFDNIPENAEIIEVEF